MANHEDIPLPDDNIQYLVQKFTTALSEFSGNMSGQRYAHLVRPFEGDPSTFREWIRQIEKFKILTNASDAELRRLAFEMSNGSANDVIQRYANTNPQCTWEQMKTALAQRFAPVSDPDHAFALLRELRQAPTETARVLSDRLVDIAEQAFRGETDRPIIERQLVGFFVDALREDYLKMRILRENPSTLSRAVDIAASEENLRMRFALRQQWTRSTGRRQNPTEEAMEIDHTRSQAACFYCGKLGHRKKDCRKRAADQRAPPRAAEQRASFRPAGQSRQHSRPRQQRFGAYQEN